MWHEAGETLKSRERRAVEYIGIYLVQVLYVLPFVPPILALLVVQPMNANKLLFAAKKTIIDSP